MRRIEIALAASALLLPIQAQSAPKVTAVQPGAHVAIGDLSCTLNFVFQAANKKYIGTAGHCGKLGDIARTTGPSKRLGRIVWREYERAPGVDFALIEIDADRQAEIEPAVRTFGGPTGVTTSAQTNGGDLLLVTGYGQVFGTTAYTRDRFWVLMHDDANQYAANMIAVNGDSGGPVLHSRTGRALGTVGSWNIPSSTDIGPTVERILSRLRSDGFASIQIVTAAYEM